MAVFVFVNSDSFWALCWPPFVAMAPVWQPFGRRLAFSAYAGLELQREPFQNHFDDLVLFLIQLLRMFHAVSLKRNIFVGGRLASSMHFFSTSCPLERASAAKRSESVAWSSAAPQVRPEDHL